VKKLILLTALAGFVACAKPPIVEKPPSVVFVLMPGRDMTAVSMDTLEGMLNDAGFVALNRVLLPSVFEGLEVPESGPLTSDLAAQIGQRSRAQILITLNLHRNDEGSAYLTGAYHLQMRWIDLADGKILYSRTKAMYFRPRGSEVKDLMTACMDAYRAAHPRN
jgi:hypothetical protein